MSYVKEYLEMNFLFYLSYTRFTNETSYGNGRTALHIRSLLHASFFFPPSSSFASPRR